MVIKLMTVWMCPECGRVESGLVLKYAMFNYWCNKGECSKKLLDYELVNRKLVEEVDHD